MVHIFLPEICFCAAMPGGTEMGMKKKYMDKGIAPDEVVIGMVKTPAADSARLTGRPYCRTSYSVDKR